MATFGDRLRAAAVARWGATTAEEIAKHARWPARSIARLLAMKEAPAALRRFHALCVRVGVRMSWAIDPKDQGPMHRIGMGDPTARDCVSILDELTPEQQERWLEVGRRMGKRRRG